jgi:hypothetical protein
MSDQNEQDAAKSRLSLRPGGRLELGKTVDAGSVRQSFSHGRSKVVQVEVLKKRVITPAPRPSMAPPAAAAPRPAVTPPAVPAAPAARTPVAASARFDSDFEPITRMASTGGPMKVTPAPAQAAAKAAFSARKPYPGWTAAAPLWRAISSTVSPRR